jgi:hypothetical protein
MEVKIPGLPSLPTLYGYTLHMALNRGILVNPVNLATDKGEK